MLAACIQPQAYSRVLRADPAAKPGDRKYYKALISELRPGDTLLLPAGTYRHQLNLEGVKGKTGAWITITGPESGAPAIVTTRSDCCNTVQLGNTEYVTIRNLTVDSNSESLDAGIDGINAKGGPTHHVLIESCVLKGQSRDQQTIGISTKSSAWNWTIRGNTIIRPGTGLYLGNSDGSAPFVAGIIEGNLVVDPIGYCMEIKFQRPYVLAPGMPAGPNQTLVHDNVFIKRVAQASWPQMPDRGSRVSGARPSLLVGGFPGSGPGASDVYEIYRNFFFRNPDEALLQASGRVVIHDNIFVGEGGTAITLQHHDLPLRLAWVFNNTIYGFENGILLRNPAMEDSAIVGNLIFARSALAGPVATESDNLTDIVENASLYVAKPSVRLGEMDFYPLPGKCQGGVMDLSRFAGLLDYDRDFNGTGKAPFAHRGAYAGNGPNPGWPLSEGLKRTPR